MSLATRPLTGKTSWPVLCLAGVEQSGKTYRAVHASASDMIGRTFLIVVGEDIPEEYGLIEGQRVELIEHDGTYRGILGAVSAAVDVPPDKDGKPNLVIVDSMTRVWNLLSEQAQKTANERAKRRGKNVGDDGADIGRDLWNTATDRWYHILDTLRGHRGPVILTARLDEISGTDANGQPTRDKTWKVQGQKGLPYDVTATVQMRAYGKAFLTGVKSVRLKREPLEFTQMASDWTVESLWKGLGLEDTASIADRHHAANHAQGADAEREALLVQVKEAAEAVGVSLQEIANDWSAAHAGQHIAETTDLGGLELLRDDLRARPTTNQNDTEGNAA